MAGSPATLPRVRAPCVKNDSSICDGAATEDRGSSAPGTGVLGKLHLNAGAFASGESRAREMVMGD